MTSDGLKNGHPPAGLLIIEDLEEVAGVIREMLIAGDRAGLAAYPDHIYYWVANRLVALEMRGCRPI